MMKALDSIRERLARVIAVLMLVVMVPFAIADDVIVLADGTKVEGEIVREVNGAVWLKTTIGGLESTKFYGPSQVKEIIRDSGDVPAPHTPVNKRPTPSSDSDARTGAPRIAVITLEGMVGTYFAAKPMLEAIEYLEEEDVDVVIFKVNSGGGLTLEVQRMQDAIVNEFKPRFQVVAWIESAISAAAMTSHVIEDIYFMDQGNYGACTEFMGASLIATEGRGLEERLYQMEKASAHGGHDFRIMRSMQIEEPLSASIDEYGEVTWYQNEDGDYLVNPSDRILTLNSQTASKFGFSRGTYNTIEDLVAAMGYPEYELVGEKVPGLIHPVSKADRHMRKWRDSTKSSERRLGEYVVKYRTSLANAEGAQDKRTRGTFIGLARRELTQILRVLRGHPNLSMMQMGLLPEGIDEWEYQQNRILDELARRD